MNVPPTAWRADIDGLRAVAVLAVVLFHAGVPGFSGGFVGVDVFFVISGYLVVGLIQRELEAGTFSFKTFLARRIKRLLPAVAAMLVVTTALALPLLAPTSLVGFGRTLAATTLSGANIHLWQTADYFAEAAEFNLLLHMWSLGVEEQFYLLTPLLLLLAWRLGGRRLVVIAVAVLTIATLLLAVRNVARMPVATFFLLPTRFWELGAGALLALAPLRPLPRVVSASLSVAGLAAIGAATTLFDDAVLFPGAAALLPVAGAVAVLAARDGPVAGVLGNRLLVWLGQRSYPLYLWHWPLLALARHALLRPLDVVEGVLIVLGSLVVAEVSWRLIENPLRHGDRLRPWPFAVVVALAGIATMLIIDQGRGFPDRFPHRAPDAFSRTGEVDDKAECALDSVTGTTPWGDERCVLVDGGPTRVLLWGDSLAGHFRFGLKQTQAVPAKVYQFTTSACPPILGWQLSTRPGCATFNDRALALVKEGRFDVVVVAARWGYVFMRHGAEQQVRATLEALMATGVRVVVVGATPTFPMDVRALFLHADPAVPDTRAGTLAHTRINERLRAALPEGVVFLDPSTALCDAAGCLYREAGNFLFHDAAHLSGAGSVVVVEGALAPALQRLFGPPDRVPTP